MTGSPLNHGTPTDDRSVRSTRTILVTGFGPFPGAPFNPTGPLVRRLSRKRLPALADVRIVPHIFTTSYACVDGELPMLIARHRPDALLMFGLATRSRHVRIETLARNTLSAMPDAYGRVAAASQIDAEAQGFRSICAPDDDLLQAARRGRIPARLSRDAGGYLCNYLYWRALEAAESPEGPQFAAFIHIPDSRFAGVNGRRRRNFVFGDLVRTGDHLLRALITALPAQR